MNVDVDEVINAGGTGLAFISYPEAIAKFDAVPSVRLCLFVICTYEFNENECNIFPAQ